MEYPGYNIKIGSNNTQAVKWVQEKVGVTQDGSFGPKTEQAVKSWQQFFGLTSDGIVGSKTWEAMQYISDLDASHISDEPVDASMPSTNEGSDRADYVAMIDVERRKWDTDEPPRTPTRSWIDIKGCEVHYTGAAGPRSLSFADKQKWLLSIERYHEVTKGWSDIFYNVFVFEDGEVWAGRPELVQSQRSLFNYLTIHVPGTVGMEMSTVQKQKVADIAALVGGDLRGHGERAATSCPGVSALTFIKEYRNGKRVWEVDKTPEPEPAAEPKPEEFVIPVAHSGVNVKDLHPKLKARLGAFFADPRILGRVTVISGVRSYQQQKALYEKYLSGKGNLAANPDRRLSNGFQGSYHMAQPAFNSYGYAVDFRILQGITTTEVNNIAAEYGLVRTVSSEWWHHQASKVSNGQMIWFPTAQKIGEPASVKSEMQQVFEFIQACSKLTLREGDRGPAVELMQKLLDTNGYKLTKKPVNNSGIDGIYGKMSTAAVKRFQTDEGLVSDGICGPQTWGALLD